MGLLAAMQIPGCKSRCFPASLARDTPLCVAMSGTDPNNKSATPSAPLAPNTQGQGEQRRGYCPPGTAFDEHPYLKHDLKVVQDMIRMREHAFTQGVEEIETLRRLEWGLQIRVDAEEHDPPKMAKKGGGAD